MLGSKKRYRVVKPSKARIITVADIVNYVMSKGAPVSGLVISTLQDGFAPNTVIEAEFFSPELYKEIVEWKDVKDGQPNQTTNRKS